MPEPTPLTADEIASFKKSFDSVLHVHGRHAYWPCEDVPCRLVGRLLATLDARDAEIARITQAVHRFAYPDDGPAGQNHEDGCAVYDAYQRGPCDCGLAEVLAALATTEDTPHA